MRGWRYLNSEMTSCWQGTTETMKICSGLIVPIQVIRDVPLYKVGELNAGFGAECKLQEEPQY